MPAEFETAWRDEHHHPAKTHEDRYNTSVLVSKIWKATPFGSSAIMLNVDATAYLLSQLLGRNASSTRLTRCPPLRYGWGADHHHSQGGHHDHNRFRRL